MQAIKTDNLVSVIMPAYNAGQYISEAITSVIKQTYTNWELIVVDDGSEDDTAEIVKALTLTDARIIYLYQNRGRQGKARNLAINQSKGNYIAFLDADDIWTDKKLQIQTDILDKRPDIDLLFSRGYTLSNSNHTEMATKVKEWCWGNDSELLITANQIPVLSVLARKNAIKKAGLFSEKQEIQNAEDYHLWIKMLKNGNFLSIADKLFYYRIHPQQTTYKNSDVEMAVTYCLFDLILSGVISSNETIIQNRFKWLVFNNSNITHYLKMMKKVLPKKQFALDAIAVLNTLFPNTILVKKLIFHLL